MTMMIAIIIMIMLLLILLSKLISIASTVIAMTNYW